MAVDTVYENLHTISPRLNRQYTTVVNLGTVTINPGLCACHRFHCSVFHENPSLFVTSFTVLLPVSGPLLQFHCSSTTIRVCLSPVSLFCYQYPCLFVAGFTVLLPASGSVCHQFQCSVTSVQYLGLSVPLICCQKSDCLLPVSLTKQQTEDTKPNLNAFSLRFSVFYRPLFSFGWIFGSLGGFVFPDNFISNIHSRSSQKLKQFNGVSRWPFVVDRTINSIQWLKS